MVNIKSDLTNKSVSGGNLREIEVSDESGDQVISDVNEQISAFNQALQSRGLPPLDEPTIRQMQSRRAEVQGTAKFVKTSSGPLNSQFQPEDELEAQAMVNSARKAQNMGSRLDAGAKKRIENLCGISRVDRVVNIDGTEYVLRTLKSKEMREALLKATQFDGTIESPFEIRKQLLARALYSIQGTEIDLWLGSEALEARFDLLDELDEPLLVKLYSEYLELVKMADSKYSIRNAQEAQEVVDDLKK